MIARSRFGAIAILLCLCSCTSTHVMIGTARPPTDPATVKLYVRPPKAYDEIAILNTDAEFGGAWTAQGQMDVAVKRIKIEAAKLGANGVLLNVGEKTVGSVGGGTYVTHNASRPMVAFGSGTSLGITTKTAAGVAIYVREE